MAVEVVRIAVRHRAPFGPSIVAEAARRRAGTLAAARQYLEGRWTLVSFDVFPPGREPIRVNGAGTLVRRLRESLGRTLTHIFEGAPPIGAAAGPLATNRPRHWQVDGDLLTPRTKDDDGNDLSVAVWRKGAGPGVTLRLSKELDMKGMEFLKAVKDSRARRAPRDPPGGGVAERVKA